MVVGDPGAGKLVASRCLCNLLGRVLVLLLRWLLLLLLLWMVLRLMLLLVLLPRLKHRHLCFLQGIRSGMPLLLLAQLPPLLL